MFTYVELLEKIEKLSSRNEITQLLVEFIQSASLEESQILAYIITGRLTPTFVAAEFNFSEKNLIKVLGNLYGERGDITLLRKELGDIGLVTEKVLSEVGSGSEVQPLTEVYKMLWELLKISGKGSVLAKQELVTKFFTRLTPAEGKYFAKIVVGKIRLGVSEMTFLDALSIFKVGDKSLREKLDLVYGVNPDLGSLVYNVVTYDVDTLSVKPTPGIPILSRLVERVKSFGEVFERLGDKVIVQPKFDGLRCQVHKGVDYKLLNRTERIWVSHYSELKSDNDSLNMFDMSQDGLSGEKSESGKVDLNSSSVRLFSRNLEDMSAMFPEVVKAVELLPCSTLIFDSEVIGWDYSANSFAPFQETMTRKRKHGIEEAQSEIPVKIFPFDLVYLNGESLVVNDTDLRLTLLKELVISGATTISENMLAKIDSFQSVKGELFYTKTLSSEEVIVLADTCFVNNEEELDEVFELYVGVGLEGLIVKDFKGGYEPGRRNFSWLKLKKSMKKGLVDSVDVVIMGFYRGSGKRSDFGMGALLGGIYNPESEMVESVTKIGTGITDARWEEISKKLLPIVSKDKPLNYLVSDQLVPDVWVSPEVVCSVEADEITESKVHLAAQTLLGNGKGLALRFPRLIQFDRDDKGVRESTSPEELVKMFK